MRYYQAAVSLADAMIDRFYDPAGGGFFDTAALPGESRSALSARAANLFRTRPLRRAIPPPPRLCCAWRRSTGSKEYRDIAAKNLASFGGIVEHFGLYAGSYALALERLLADPVQVSSSARERRQRGWKRWPRTASLSINPCCVSAPSN